jgi:hypothetical protein
MPTKAELEAELAALKARIAVAPPQNYMQRVNPNLIITLHYAGKALWLVLAAMFGVIGYQLYALGIKAVGNAEATLPLGISFTLRDAGPGLIVMVMALLCSLVGAVKAKVRLTPEAIDLMGRQQDGDRGHGKQPPDAHDTVTIQGIKNLNVVWGLIEVAQLYRTPVSDLVSEEEAAEIARLQARDPSPETWADDVCSVVRASARFKSWLRALPTRDLPAFGSRKVRVDPSLPWCVRLRWGGRVAATVDVFVCATADGTRSANG